MIKSHSAYLMSIKTIAADTTEVTFDTSKDPIHFTAGQYITVTAPGLERLGIKEQTHDFSIVSSPNDHARLAISFRVSQSRFKQTLLSLPLGTEVTLEGPSGIFTLPEDSAMPLIFIAGGVGIDPFMSIIRFVTESNLDFKITLYYFNKSTDTESYRDELKALAAKNHFLKIHEVFGHFDKKYIDTDNISKTKWYIAGPPGMVANARQSIIELGVSDINIRTEEFTGYD